MNFIEQHATVLRNICLLQGAGLDLINPDVECADFYSSNSHKALCHTKGREKGCLILWKEEGRTDF